MHLTFVDKIDELKQSYAKSDQRASDLETNLQSAERRLARCEQENDELLNQLQEKGDSDKMMEQLAQLESAKVIHLSNRSKKKGFCFEPFIICDVILYH